ncbi:MAG TPA: hypothetical protein VEK34_10130, partial [Methylocella sp.]|nr:hypothetical protein [Methylocella sp.]
MPEDEDSAERRVQSGLARCGASLRENQIFYIPAVLDTKWQSHRISLEEPAMLSRIYLVMTTIAALMFSRPILAEPTPTNMPDYSLEKSCVLLYGHLRPLASCLSQETRYRGEAAEMWARTPDSDRGRCA